MLSWVPRWTDNPNFNAQAAHFFVGFSTGMVIFSKTHEPYRFYFSLAALSCFALKEFWYDANFELPPQTASDNEEDFLFYAAGFVIGSIVGVL